MRPGDRHAAGVLKKMGVLDAAFACVSVSCEGRANHRKREVIGVASSLLLFFAQVAPASEGAPQQPISSRSSDSSSSHANKQPAFCCVLSQVAPASEAPQQPSTRPTDTSSSHANSMALLQQGMLETLMPLCLSGGGVASTAVSTQVRSLCASFNRKIKDQHHVV